MLADTLRKTCGALLASVIAVQSTGCAAPAGRPADVAAPVPTLPAALSGARREFSSATTGRVSYYAAGPDAPGSARPLLLIHSINASGSAYEVKPLYEHYRRERAVFALDLPGFGFSERSDRVYSPRLMTDALLAMLDEIQRTTGATQVDALALSLSAEFLARAANERPEAFASLALVSPTGFSGMTRREGPPESTRGLPWLYRLLTWSVWDDGLYGLLTRPGVIRYFLERTWGGRNIDEGLLAYDVLSTRQPGAKHAPFYFLSAELFSKDINTLYDRLAMPVWMSHGVRGDFVDYRGANAMQARPNWRFSVFQTGALPYFEAEPEFVEAYDHFLNGRGATAP